MVYRELSFSLSPIEVMSIELMNSIAITMVKLFVPVLLLIVGLKMWVAKRAGIALPTPRVRHSFRYQLRASVAVGMGFGVWFYLYTLAFAPTAAGLKLFVASSEIAVMFATGVLLTFAMLTGLARAFSPILSLSAKRK